MNSRETLRISRSSEPRLKSHTVLVVDDDRTVLSTVMRTLNVRGIDVHLAESGPEALEILREHSIDAIIADLHMPTMRGTDLLAEIRRAFPDVIRILLTADDSGAAAREAINRAEVHRYLVKPWEPDQLVDAILESLVAHRSTNATRALLATYESAFPGIGEAPVQGSPYVIDSVRVAVGIDGLRTTVGE